MLPSIFPRILTWIFQDEIVRQNKAYFLFSQSIYGKPTEINPESLPTNWLCSQKLNHTTYQSGDRLVVACIFPSMKSLKNDPFLARVKQLLNGVDHEILEFPLDGISGKRSQPRGKESYEDGCSRTEQAIKQVLSNEELSTKISQAHEILVLTVSCIKPVWLLETFKRGRFWLRATDGRMG